MAPHSLYIIWVPGKPCRDKFSQQIRIQPVLRKCGENFASAQEPSRSEVEKGSQTRSARPGSV